MKHFICSLFVVLTSGSLFAAECPDFSGNYVLTEANGTNTWLHILQDECSRLSMSFDYNHQFLVTRTLVFDGVKHLVFSSSEVLSYETDTINKDEINFETEDEYLREKKRYTSRGKMLIDSEGSLLEAVESFDHNGKLLKATESTYMRIKK